MSTPAKITVANTGTRRVIVGPPARTKGGGTLVKLDTAADEKVPAAKRIGQSKVVEGAMAETIKASKVVEAVGPRIGLRVS